MRLWIFSDTHYGFGTPAIPEADVAVVAGDLCEGIPEAVEWLAETVRPHMRVVFVPGNHEFYGRTLETELLQGRRIARARGIDLLDDDSVVIDGVRFVGSTLWTDYRLFGEARRRDAMDAAYRGMNDHRHISTGSGAAWRRFLPSDAADRHAASVRFLAGFAHDRTRPTVVVTHHAPSVRCLDRKFEGDPLNSGFASNLDGLVEALAADLWVHGHTHANADVRIGPTRVVCNPHGYGSENAGFDPGLVIDIPDGDTP